MLFTNVSLVAIEKPDIFDKQRKRLSCRSAFRLNISLKQDFFRYVHKKNKRFSDFYQHFLIVYSKYINSDKFSSSIRFAIIQPLTLTLLL